MKKILSILLFLGFIASASAYDVNFNPSFSGTYAEDSTLEVTGLNGSQTYEFHYGIDGGDGSLIQKFQTDANGFASIQFDYKPVERGLNLPPQYVLTKENQTSPLSYGDQLTNTFSLYSPGWGTPDGFDDGSVYSNLFTVQDNFGYNSQSSVSEANSRITFSMEADTDSFSGGSTKLLYDAEVSRNQYVAIEYPQNSCNQLSCNIRIDGQTAVNIQNIQGDQTLDLLYNTDTRTYQILNENGTVLSESSQTGYSGLDAGLGISAGASSSEQDSFSIESISVLPKAHQDNFPDPLKFESSAGTVQFGFVESSILPIDSPGFQFNDGSGFTASTSEIDLGSSLEIKNTGSGSGYVYPTVNKAGLINLLEPEDETLVTDSNRDFKANFSFDSNVLGTSSGYAYLQFNSGNGWNDADVNTWEVCEQDGEDCVPREPIAGQPDNALYLSGNNDMNRVVQANANVQDLGVGSVDWRIKVEPGYSLGETTEIVSESRSFTRFVADSEVSMINPVDGQTITTLRPLFQLSAETAEGGILRLNYDNETLNSWTLGSPVTDVFAYEPEIPLTEGSHNATASFTGYSSKQAYSEQVNFNINTSASSIANISTIYPADGEEVSTNSVDLRYEINTTEPGTVEVILDGRTISTRNIQAQNIQLTDSVLGLDAGTHQWRVRFTTDSNVVFATDLQSFERVENIDLEQVSPEDEGSVESVPILFRTNISTGTSGELRIRMNGDIVASKDVSAGSNQTVELSADGEYPAGKKQWTAVFQSDETGNTYESGIRVFTLETSSVPLEGVPSDVGGSLGAFLTDAVGSSMGLNQSETMTLFSFVASVVAGIGLTVVTENSSAGIGGFASGILVFTALAWMPWYIGVTVLIITGLLVSGAITGLIGG